MRCVLLFLTGTIRPTDVEVPDESKPPRELVLVERGRGPVRFRRWRSTETGVPTYEEVEDAVESG